MRGIHAIGGAAEFPTVETMISAHGVVMGHRWGDFRGDIDATVEQLGARLAGPVPVSRGIITDRHMNASASSNSLVNTTIPRSLVSHTSPAMWSRPRLWGLLTLVPLGAAIGCAALAAQAATIVPPMSLASDTTWDAAGSPYVVTGDVFIPPGVTLFLGNNTTVLFTGPWKISSNGGIQAVSQGGSIAFARAMNASSSEWAGIELNGNASADLSGVAFDRAALAIACRGCAALNVSASRFTNSTGEALNVSGLDALVVASVQIVNVSSPIVGLNLTNALFDHIVIAGCGGGIALTGASNGTATNITINNTVGTGLQLFAPRGFQVRFADVLAQTAFAIDSSENTSLRFVAATAAYGLVALGTTTNLTIADFSFIDVASEGIHLVGATNALLRNGSISSTIGTAMYLKQSQDITIDNVSVRNVSYGIYAESCSSITVTRFFASHASDGLFALFCVTVRLSASSIVDSQAYPVYLSDVWGFLSWSNNFVGASGTPYSVRGSGNAWDLGGRGNFWYPHSYADADSDGIGDQPYNISGPSGERDLFPLMNASWVLAPDIRVIAPPEADEDIPFAVQLLINDPLGRPSATWNASGGATFFNESLSSASVVAPTPGGLSVRVTVRNLAGISASAVVNITIRDTTPPSAACVGPSAVPAGGIATFTSASSTDNDPAFPSNATARWNITDPLGASTVTATPFGGFAFSPPFPGNYSVVCSVLDSAGNTGMNSVTLRALDVMTPVIGVPSPVTGPEDSPISLGPLAIMDDDPFFNATGTVHWTISRSGFPLFFGDGFVLRLTIADPGRYDGNASVCDASANCVVGQFPVVIGDLTPPDGPPNATLEVVAGERSMLIADFVHDNDPEFPGRATFSWTLYLPTGTLELAGGSVAVTIAPPGAYPGWLNVTDASGNRRSIVLSIRALDREAPAIAVTYPRDAELGEPMHFDASASLDVSLPLFIQWDFGDGAPLSEGPTAVHSFFGRGNIEVTLTVTDAAGNSNSSLLAVRVRDTTPPAVRIVLPTNNSSFRAGETVDFQAEISDHSPVAKVTWAFPDGATAEGPLVAHAFPVGGAWRVTVSVADAAGNQNVTSFNVTISSAAGTDQTLPWVTVGVIAAAVAVIFAWRLRERRTKRQ